MAVATKPTQHAVVVSASVWENVHTLLIENGYKLEAMPQLPGRAPAYAITAAAKPIAEPETLHTYNGRVLTPREMQTLRGMASGKLNAAIAAELFIGTNTVKTHAKNLFAKLGATGRTDAVAIAYKAGLLGGAS